MRCSPFLGCLTLVLLAWPASGAATRALSCGEITACTDRCAGACPRGSGPACVYTCHRQCRRQGCPSARPVYDALATCVRQHCLRPCAGGPSPECTRCGERSCRELRQRCNDHRCAGGASLGESVACAADGIALETTAILRAAPAP